MWHEQRCGVLLQCLSINLVVAAAATATEWLCLQSPNSFSHLLTISLPIIHQN